jgi:hypothetical protein
MPVKEEEEEGSPLFLRDLLHRKFSEIHKVTKLFL